jgi:hypothetical protein
MAIDLKTTHCHYYTPTYIFNALGCEFDLDPASPGLEQAFVPAKNCFTETDDGLIQDWTGFVWLNPPYGRSVMTKWIDKFISHGNGILLVPDRTSASWWHKAHQNCSSFMQLRKRIPFIVPAHMPQPKYPGPNPLGTTLFAMGSRGDLALQTAWGNGLGALSLPYRS